MQQHRWRRGPSGLDFPGLLAVLCIAGWSTMPIIVLSGRGDTRVKVAALDAGADDYLDKPFAIEELFGRLRAVVRRDQPKGGSPPGLRIGRWLVDFAAHLVMAPTRGVSGRPAVRGDAQHRMDAGDDAGAGFRGCRRRGSC